MKSSVELKQERASLKDKQTALIAKAKTEKRDMTDTENVEFDGFMDQRNALDAQIKRAEQIEKDDLEAARFAGTTVGGSEQREHEKMKSRYDFHKAIRSQMPNGVLDGVEKEIHEETKQRAQDAGVMISGLAVPTNFTEKRADGATVTQDSGAFGGNLVDTQQQSPIEFLRPKPILESLGARFMSGFTGNLRFPTNGGGISGAWEGEVDTASNSKNAYGSKEMKPNRYAVSALLSLQNLMQSSIDLQMFTVQDIRNVIANAIDAAGINGAANAEGILSAADVNAIVGGTNGAAPSWKHIVDLETKVYSANADASKMAYLINPATKGFLKQTKHQAGDLNYLMSGANEINGYKTGVSNLVPGDLTKGTLTAGNAGIFGDFSQLLIGQWGFLDLSVDNTSKKKDGYIELVVNTFIDTLVRQPKAFSAIKDWDLS